MIPGQLDISDLPWKFIICIGIFFGLRTYFRGPKCFSKKMLKDKIAIVTGANSGIGFEIVKDLYNRGATVIMACKDINSGDKAKKLITDEIKKDSDMLVVKYLDLGSLKSVTNFAEYINKDFDHIDLLVNNAGTMMHPYETTEDGLEIHFQANYLGHFMLTLLIIKQLLKAKNGRIINVSSIAHRLGDCDLLSNISERSQNGNNGLNQDKFRAHPREYYALSKLAMVLWSRHMGKLMEGSHVTINACHPGLAFTNIMRHMPFYTNSFMYLTSFPFIWFFTKTAKDAAQTPLFCTLDDDYMKDINGKYLSDCQLSEPGLNAKNDEACEKLWKISLKLIGLPENYTPCNNLE